MPIFFWKTSEQPYGVFSQWYLSKIKYNDDITFNCCEQFMMYSKAMLFNDKETAQMRFLKKLKLQLL